MLCLRRKQSKVNPAASKSQPNNNRRFQKQYILQITAGKPHVLYWHNRRPVYMYLVSTLDPQTMYSPLTTNPLSTTTYSCDHGVHKRSHLVPTILKSKSTSSLLIAASLIGQGIRGNQILSHMHRRKQALVYSSTRNHPYCRYEE